MYVKLPCLRYWHGGLPNAVRELYMLGLRPKPKRGLCPLHPGRGRPRGRSVKCSENLQATFREKALPQYHSVQKFLGVRGPFFKKVPAGKPPRAFYRVQLNLCVCFSGLSILPKGQHTPIPISLEIFGEGVRGNTFL